MIGARTEVTAILETLTPLHVGSGERRSLGSEDRSTDQSADGQSKEPGVALLQFDARGMPVIPGASLKGVLRRLAETPETLFGPEKRKGDAGDPLIAGKILFRSALLEKPGPIETSDPRLELPTTPTAPTTGRQAGLMYDTRVAIDAATGVAEKARLFTVQMVRPGTRFAVTLVVSHTLEEKDLEGLAGVLARASADEGFSIGKGTRHAQGRLRLLPDTLRATDRVPGERASDTTTAWQERLKSARSRSAAAPAVRLRLSTEGPYLIADSVEADATSDEGQAPQIRGLRATDADAPRLTGPTILGALRAASAWLEALEDPDIEDDRDAVLKSALAARTLTRTQRLFGVTGWRGRVGVSGIRLANSPEKSTIMSVRIDRFSGAPIDNALFGTEAWIAPVFEIGLTLDETGLIDGDEDHFDRLLKLLKHDIWGGLQLGLGKNKGYGAFRVETIDG